MGKRTMMITVKMKSRLNIIIFDLTTNSKIKPTNSIDSIKCFVFKPNEKHSTHSTVYRIKKNEFLKVISV